MQAEVERLREIAAKWSISELNEGIEILREWKKARASQVAARFRPGQMVEFNIGRHRGWTRFDRVRGRVVKKLRKNVAVQAMKARNKVTGDWESVSGEWKVYPGKLEEVE